jgi:hypothetical protein
MLKISFELDGLAVNPSNIGDALERAVLKNVEEQVRTKLTGIRDPQTGEFPLVAVRGTSLDNLSFQVSGSRQLVALVRERLGLEAKNEAESSEMTAKSPPIAFVCHASEDKQLARRIAEDFHGNGIETFFDEWEIAPGDSIRQKIDAGLGKCTHFVVLLTPNSINKPWVNVEIDGAFVKKVEGRCKFIPLRHTLSLTALPPLLGALRSPVLEKYEEDMRALINSIWEVSQKPPLGPAPRVVIESSSREIGLSPAAQAIVRLIEERSETGCKFDPQLDADEIRDATRLPEDDIIDAVDELEGRGFVGRHRTLGEGSIGFRVLYAEAALFVEFDRHFQDWDPEADAQRIAADLVNGAGEADTSSLAESYGWSPRRINPAINYLRERNLVETSASLGVHPWCVAFVRKNTATRRFVRDRS